MQVPVQVTFHRLDYSPSIATSIRKKAAKLERFYPRIMSCRVIVEPSSHRHHQGNLYHLRIEITVPGGNLVVSRDPGAHAAHEDIYVTIRDAFDAARRKLEDYTRTHFYKKTHGRTSPPHGRIVRLFPNEDCGFIQTATTKGGKREIFFHRNSVLGNGFNRLKIGDEVRFSEENGEKGAQASTVEPIGRHGTHSIKIA